MREMSSNFCMKFATKIQFWVAIKTVLNSKLQCEPDYFDTVYIHVYLKYNNDTKNNNNNNNSNNNKNNVYLH